jgi:hypothetical protein
MTTLGEPASPPVAQVANRRVMISQWVEPGSQTPSHARNAPTVRGFRAFCPIRRMAQRLNANGHVAPEHVAAADCLRKDYDLARLGRGGSNWLRLFTDPNYGHELIALRDKLAGLTLDGRQDHAPHSPRLDSPLRTA